MAGSIDSAWRALQKEIAAGRAARAYGFAAKDGDVSRYVARFRIAKAYRGSTFEATSAPTAEAYSALIGLTLAWGAFEQLAKICGFVVPRGTLDYRKIDDVFEHYSGTLVGDDWQAVRPVYKFLATLQTGDKLIDALNDASLGKPLQPRQLVIALRNAFAHGQLTAHFGGTSPRTTARACRALSAHLLLMQANHFSHLVLANIGLQRTAVGAK